MEKQKRVLCVHDLSCVGRCSLSVILPVLSAAGLEASAMPTAVLSTHTGGFSSPVFRDLTDEMPQMAAHWLSEGISFDAVYTGYLGSVHQAETVARLIDENGAGARIFVDPVMGDSGRIYSGLSAELAGRLRELCRKADVIIPNTTEAALLLGERYVEGPHSPGHIEDLTRRLSGLTGGCVVLTGVYFDERELGSSVYDPATGRVFFVMGERKSGQYHGSGDMFAAALIAAQLCGRSLPEAADTAGNFVRRAIELSDTEDSRMGLRFEAALPELMRSLEII